MNLEHGLQLLSTDQGRMKQCASKMSPRQDARGADHPTGSLIMAVPRSLGLRFSTQQRHQQSPEELVDDDAKVECSVR